MGGESFATRVFANALAPPISSDVKRTAEALSHCSNYWIPRDIIEFGHGATPTEHAVTALFDLVSPSLPQEDWAGAEYWIQIYESGRGLAFHFDKDEHAMKEEGRMVNPILSSVLYLTGGSDGEFSSPSGTPLRVLQAPTVVNDQLYDQHTRSTIPEDPTSNTFIFPRENSYCVFDGRLGHGVLDSGCKEERMTLLINWWQTKPENIDRIPLDSPSEKEMKIENEAATVEKNSLIKLKATSLLPECIYPEIIQVTEGDLGEDGIVLIDDVLAARGKAVIGKDAVHAVTLEHPGLCLYPLDNEQLLQMEEQGDIMQVAACLGPLPGASSSSSSSSDSGN